MLTHSLTQSTSHRHRYFPSPTPVSLTAAGKTKNTHIVSRELLHGAGSMLPCWQTACWWHRAQLGPNGSSTNDWKSSGPFSQLASLAAFLSAHYPPPPPTRRLGSWTFLSHGDRANWLSEPNKQCCSSLSLCCTDHNDQVHFWVWWHLCPHQCAIVKLQCAL